MTDARKGLKETLAFKLLFWTDGTTPEESHQVYGAKAETMWGHLEEWQRDDFRFAAGQVLKEVAELVEALEEAKHIIAMRKHHDEGCADSTEEFKPDEMCECGASLCEPFLSKFRGEKV